MNTIKKRTATDVIMPVRNLVVSVTLIRLLTILINVDRRSPTIAEDWAIRPSSEFMILRSIRRDVITGKGVMERAGEMKKAWKGVPEFMVE